MAAMEKLFVQIFERKKWIIDQAKHQTNLFDQHLASKLIIDGIVPPPWLHSSFLPSHISHFEVAEVNRNFTSGVEFPRSPLETHRSSLNEELVADGREELQHRSNEEAGCLNDEFDAGIRLSVLPQCDISDAETHRSSLNEELVPDGREELQHRLNEEAGCLNDDFDAGIRLSVLPQCDISDAETHRSNLNEELVAGGKEELQHRSNEEAGCLNDDFDEGTRLSVLPQCDISDAETHRSSLDEELVADGMEELQHRLNEEAGCLNYNFDAEIRLSVLPQCDISDALVADGREELQHRLNEEAGCLNDDCDAGIRLSILPQCDISDAGGVLNCAPHIDMSPVSPQGRGGVVSENYQEPTMSLARLHRSKSRQRALELRNSVKSAKCQSRCENKNDSFAGGIVGSAISLLQADHEDELELAKPFSSCKGIGSVEEETNVCCEQKDISISSDKITIVGSPGLQSSSINVGDSSNISSKDEGLCVAGGSTRNSYQVNEQFDSPRPSSGKIEYREEASGCCRSQECNFDNAEQSRLQCSYLDVEKSSCTSPEDGRACPVGGSKLHSDHMDEQLELPKPSSGNIECHDEMVLEHCRSEECNLDNAVQSGSQHSSLDVDDSSYIDSGDGSLLDLSKPSSGNTECYEETILGDSRSQECNFDNAQQSGSPYSSQDVDNSLYVDSEGGRSCPIGSSKMHSDQVKEPLDLSKSSSDNMECCEEEILGHFRSQEYKFNNAQQSGMQHSSLDADNSPCFSSEYGTLCPVGSSKRHSDQVSEPLELCRPSSVDIECHDEGLGDCRIQDYNFDNNAEQSGLDKMSSPIMEVMEKTSDKKLSTFLEDKRDFNEKEKCNSPLHMPLPQIQVDPLKEGESYKGVPEFHSEKRYEDGGYLNGNALSSSEKSLQGYEKVAACPLLQSDEPAEQNISLKDGVPNLQFSHENVVEIPQVDTDDASVLIRDTETFRDLMVMASSVPSAGERYSNLEQQLKNSGISQCEDSDSFEGCTGDFNGNHHNISTECQTAEKSIEFKTFSSVLKASSSHENHRKVELQLENGVPASLDLMSEKLQIINRSPIDQNSMQEFDNENPVLEFQRLSFCEEDLSRYGSNNRGTTLRNVMLESQSLDPKENLQFGENELPVDTGKTEGEEENGKLTSHSLITPTSYYLGADKDMPALEGFLMQADDDEQPCISVGRINFDKLDLSKCMIERASILEKLCKSACINSPLSSSSESFKLNKVTDLYHSLPSGLQESMDLKSNLLMNDQNKPLKDGSNFLNGEVNCTPHGRSFSDGLQSFSSHSASDIRKPFASPFGKLLDRNSLTSYSSGKRSSQNTELPCISEEAENTDEIDDEFSEDVGSEKRVPLADITENANVQVTVSEAATFPDRSSLESLNTELSNTGTHNRTKENLGNQKSSKRKYLNEAASHDILPGANGAKRVTRSSYNRFIRSDLSCKENFRKEGPRFSEKESKHKNIVSNITSFIPLVQRKEAATILKGKRDIKVKAIEAAEAAKRFAEKKENERLMKKEALKLERARMEQENLRQIELEKKKKEEERKKKEEERKKKDADMAAKKRQREEEERKERERKRMRVEEVRRRLREHGGKLRSDKENKEAKPQANDQKPRDRKGCKDATDNLDKESVPENFDKLSVKTTSTSDAGKASFVVEDLQKKSVDFLETEALKNVMENGISETIEEESYQISPYKASDDEDEEDDDDDIQNNKFVPSWASKNRLAALFASQQKLNPEIIFPPKSFCDIAEVLLPRQHQSK